MSAPMVRAILDGRKTQTRRMIKEPETLPDRGCPYGVPGDRLWVRETFCLQQDVMGENPPFSDGRPLKTADEKYASYAWLQPHYRATDAEPELDIGTDEPGVIWRPSIFMPRWASRITLELTDVRVQRVQEISEGDALAEGCQMEPGPTETEISEELIAAEAALARALGDGMFTAKFAYMDLWDSINAKRGYPWSANPFVWALTFRRVS